MSDAIADRDVLLIVSGGIAAYKSAALARELLRRGARVEVVLTEAAQRFVGAVTFAGITGRTVHTDLWDPRVPGELHIALGERANLLVVAPATANLMARAALGLADDLASAVLLSADRPTVMAPAMHTRMWEHPATRENVRRLAERGVRFVGPETGALASGAVGPGRMSEPLAIADAASAMFAGDLAKLRVLVTAGATFEPIDPVRFVGNRSSGKMGVALADRAEARGATVTLVHGPMTAPAPARVRTVRVNTAIEMRDAVLSAARESDVVIMAAAVADYRPADPSPEKIKKDTDELALRLVRNPDILSELGAARGSKHSPVLVGFALETSDLIRAARQKLEKKRCDLIVANLAEHGFEGDDNVVTLVSREGTTDLGKRSKREIADRVLDAIVALRT